MSTYNGEKYLREQIESFFSQTEKDWQLYIRDDGSKDNTCRLISEYVRRFPQKIHLVDDIKTNLGLVGTESTFGGYSKELGNPVSTYDSHDLVNNHAYFGNPYTDYSKAIYRKVSKEINQGKDSDRAWMDAENDAEYAYKHNNIKTRTKKYHDNVIADAFARYADNPKGYNPGKGSVYPKVVTRIGNEVWSDP